jgi:uncharacterized protein with von Willebrand factor type A (vWA) domain
MIKRARDLPLFETLFDLHFAGGPTLNEAAETEGVSKKLAEIAAEYPSDFSPETQMLLSGNFGALTRRLLDQSRMLSADLTGIPPLRGNYFIRRLERMMGLDTMRAETEDFLAEMSRHGLDQDSAQEARDYVDLSLGRLSREIEETVEREIAVNRFLSIRRLDEEELAEQSLYGLTDDDWKAMRPAVERLARKLRDRIGMRLKRAGRGRFDIKATMRENIGLGGPLPNLRFRKKKPSRPQITALCDVSRSVRDFSHFMLLFLYALKEVVDRIKSFIFIGDLSETTLLFQQRDVNEAVSMAAAGFGLRYRFRTDYGAALTQFAEEHGAGVNGRTTFIILGDARNNNFAPHTEALASIAQKSKKILWLNPEPRSLWGSGDSCMNLYGPYCEKVIECGSLNQLVRAVDNNMLY